MEVARIDRETYIKLAVKEYSTLSKMVLKVNLYTVVQACVKAAEAYSYQVSHLYRGGMGSLILAALEDVIKRLSQEKKVSDEQYTELCRQYQRDAEGALPDVVTCLMQLQGTSPLRRR